MPGVLDAFTTQSVDGFNEPASLVGSRRRRVPSLGVGRTTRDRCRGISTVSSVSWCWYWYSWLGRSGSPPLYKSFPLFHRLITHLLSPDLLRPPVSVSYRFGCLALAFGLFPSCLLSIFGSPRSQDCPPKIGDLVTCSFCLSHVPRPVQVGDKDLLWDGLPPGLVLLEPSFLYLLISIDCIFQLLGRWRCRTRLS